MIIGFSGPAGAGKSTAAKILVEQHGFLHLRFAGPLKAMMRVLIGEEWIDGAMKESVHPVLGCTPRHAMQTLGTEWGRNLIHPDLWVNLAEESMMGAGDVVFDDVRFQNEYDLIHRYGGQVIQIRPKVITPKPFSHVSEVGCQYDRFLYNEGSIEDLRQSLALMLSSR